MASRSLMFLLIGIVVGWSAARYQGGAKIRLSTSRAAANSMEEQLGEGSRSMSTVRPPIGEKPVASVVATNITPPALSAAVVPAPSSTLVEQMSNLKIAELHKYCEDAETRYIDGKMNANGKGIYEFPAAERDALVAEWSRRFSDLVANNGVYWKGSFTIEAGGDVIAFDVLMDLQSEIDERSKCVRYNLYYEVNGKPTLDSMFWQSFCDGSGFRKKGDHFYFDISTYSFIGVGKHVTVVLLPMPGGSGAEYLGGEAEKWIPISQFNWQKSSIFEISQLQQRFQQKVDLQGEQ